MTRTRATQKTAATKAKKTTSPRPARKTTAKKTTPATPRLSLVKPVDHRPGLPTRARDYVTDAQIYAHHAARLAGLPIHRIREWTDHRNGTATRQLADGSYLHYRHDTRTLTWHARCPMGAPHQYVITTPSTAAAARVHAARCAIPHADLTHLTALTSEEFAELGFVIDRTWGDPDTTDTIPVPLPKPQPEPVPRALGDQLTRTHADTTETQPIPRDEIAAGLAARTDNDTPKEHPEP